MSFKEIRAAVESVSNEKGVATKVIFEAIELALATATKKRYRENAEFRVSINWEEDTYDTFRTWLVVDLAQFASQAPPSSDETMDVYNPDAHLTEDEAREKDPSLVLGDTHEEPVDSVPFGRIVAQTAKQVILQKVREAEREQVAQEYRPRVGELVSGTVKKTSRDSVVIDLGNNAEGLLARDHLIPRETFRVGDRVRAYLVEVRSELRGPQLMLTRTSSEMLIELFKIEVPEIAEDVIEIRAAARDPGSRAKIAVTTNDGRIDAVGACVGMRGSRVQAVSGELAG
ncbi:transcription termination factor NusA, partial [Myxococcota bacterium]|nr:transcription termination factor NusA [Myxococcota bacterium]